MGHNGAEALKPPYLSSPGKTPEPAGVTGLIVVKTEVLLPSRRPRVGLPGSGSSLPHRAPGGLTVVWLSRLHLHPTFNFHLTP